MFSHFRFSHVHDKLKFYTSDLSYNRPVARIFRGGGGGGGCVYLKNRDQNLINDMSCMQVPTTQG